MSRVFRRLSSSLTSFSYPHMSLPAMYPNDPPVNVKIDYAGTTAGGPGPSWQDSRAAALGGNDGMRDIGASISPITQKSH